MCTTRMKRWNRSYQLSCGLEQCDCRPKRSPHRFVPLTYLTEVQWGVLRSISPLFFLRFIGCWFVGLLVCWFVWLFGCWLFLSCGQVAPFESAELEVCWTADDALQRWQEVCGASRAMAVVHGSGWSFWGMASTAVDGKIPRPSTWDFCRTLANNGTNYQAQLVN